jgi:LysM repeat protein
MKPNKNVLILGLIFLTFGVFGQQNPKYLAYIEKFKDLAVREMQRVGIPASITMAQGLVESGAGQSELAVNAHNHFGIKKGSNWTGGVYYVKDDDYANGVLVPSPFRVYASDDDSYKGHSDFLRGGQRYASLFLLKPTDYKGWAQGLLAAGYATEPKYADMLIRTVENYQLYKLDGAGGPADVADAADQIANYPINKIISVNGLKAVLVSDKITLEEVAGRYSSKAKCLQEFNENIGPRDETLKANTLVFLEKKNRNYHGGSKYHFVKPGERMYDIAQKYGIRLSKLYSKNEMQMGTEPAIGEKMILNRCFLQGWKTPRLRDASKDPVLAPSDPGYMNTGQPMNTGGNPNTSNRPSNNNPTSPSNANNPRPSAPPVAPPKPAGTPNKDGTLDIDIVPGGVVTPSTQPSAPTQPSSGVVVPIPMPAPIKPAPSNSGPADDAPTDGSYHQVTNGDTLYNIAKRYNTTVAKIQKMNGMTGNGIKLGQKLKVK